MTAWSCSPVHGSDITQAVINPGMLGTGGSLYFFFASPDRYSPAFFRISLICPSVLAR